MHRRYPRWGAALVVAAALGLSTVVAALPASAQPSPPTPTPVHVQGTTGDVTRSTAATDRSPSGATCADYSLPVTAMPGQTQVYTVFGRLCGPGNFDGRTVQLLLHGGGYNHYYWDWPYQPERYSYVKAAAAAGYATLNIDRLGYGYSDRPVVDAAIGFDSDAWVAHQVIQYLRTGALGVRFAKIAEVGHSLGSATATIEAGRYQDVDALVVSGGAHNVNPINVFKQVSFYPASLDPKFRGSVPLGSTYLTNTPGSRCRTYYLQGQVDPGVCAADEQLKDTLTSGEFAGFAAAFDSRTPSDQIVAPVFIALADHDQFMCLGPNPLAPTCNSPGSLAYREPSYYPNAKSAQLYFQPDSGHMNNLHYSAPQFFSAVNTWITRQIGVRATN